MRKMMFSSLFVPSANGGGMENTMQHKRKVCLSVTILCLLASLLATGCGGAGSKKGALAPSGKSGVDAVLQQQMNAADTKAGGGQNRAAEGQAGGAAKMPAPVSARQMKEMEEKIPRMNVYDEKLIYTKVDYDFSKMNRNMMYTQIYNMLKTPDEFKGKIVRMQGTFGHYYDEKTGKHYYGCIVADAAACCKTGMEFSRRGVHSYPGNYPKVDEPIVVTGRFSSYKEGNQLYCELAEAEIEKM